LKLIKQHDLPFDPNEFYKPVQQMETKDKIRGRENMQRRATVVQDMLKTLSKGFGVAGGQPEPTQPDVMSMLSGEDTVRSAREHNEV
jgi:hypothetical protein